MTSALTPGRVAAMIANQRPTPELVALEAELDELTFTQLVGLIAYMDEVPCLVSALRPSGPAVRDAYKRHGFFWLYAIQAGQDGPIKLGSTRDPAVRLATLQTANADRLHGIAAWRGLPGQEAAMHRLFRPLHVRGEWYRPADWLLKFLEQQGDWFGDWEKP